MVLLYWYMSDICLVRYQVQICLYGREETLTCKITLLMGKTLHSFSFENLASVQLNIVFWGEKFGLPPLFSSRHSYSSLCMYFNSSVLYSSTTFCLPSYSYNNSCFELNCLKNRMACYCRVPWISLIYALFDLRTSILSSYKAISKCRPYPRVGGWVFSSTFVARWGCESERADLHTTLAQLRLEPVLGLLADFLNCLALSSLYRYLNAFRS
jgi:hypothetical protein